MDRFWFISWLAGIILCVSFGIYAISENESGASTGLFILAGVIGFGGLALIKQEYY